MSELPDSAYVAGSDGAYLATDLTRGPWQPQHQHAGPPIALVARAIERVVTPLGMSHVARLTANLLRPIPIGTLGIRIETQYVGRNVAHLAAQLEADGKLVAVFTALAQRDATLVLPDNPARGNSPRAPRPAEISPVAIFPFGKGEIGYSDLVEARVAQGTFFSGPCAAWFRLRRPLLAGEEPSPLQRVAVAADSGNGISAALDFRRYLFLNSDLTINLFRRAVGEWICIDARTWLGTDGAGLAQARIFDAQGLIGRSTQSLLVRPRE